MIPKTPPGATRSTRNALAYQRQCARSHLYNLYVKPFINKLPTTITDPLIIQYPFDYTKSQIRHQWRSYFENNPSLLGHFRLSFTTNSAGWVLTITPKLPTAPLPTQCPTILSAPCQTPQQKTQQELEFLRDIAQHDPDVAKTLKQKEQAGSEAATKQVAKLPPHGEAASSMSKFGQPTGNEAVPPIEEDADCELNEDEQELLDIVADAEEDPNA